MKHEFEVGVGNIVKDKVTGFEGTVVSLTTYLHGADRACVTPTVLKDGRPQSDQWVDVSQLTIVSIPVT